MPGGMGAGFFFLGPVKVGSTAPPAEDDYFVDDAQTDQFFVDDAQTDPLKVKD